MAITIDDQGYIHGPMVVQVPGPPAKVNRAPNSGEGLALHSVVGEEREFDDGIPGRFLDTSVYYDPALGMYRFTAYAAASCQMILRKFATVAKGYATLIQMYPLTASTWTSGGSAANERFLSMEMEGGGYLNGLPNFGEPMNDFQVATFRELIPAIEAWKARQTGRPFKLVQGVNLLQHKEIAARYGYAATACASDRYDRGLEAVRKDREDGMSPDEKKIVEYATGDYHRMRNAYHNLVALGRLPDLGLPATDPPGTDVETRMSVLNSAVVKRFALLGLAVSDPGAASLLP